MHNLQELKFIMLKECAELTNISLLHVHVRAATYIIIIIIYCTCIQCIQLHFLQLKHIYMCLESIKSSSPDFPF